MDRRFDGRGTLPARPIGRLSPSAVFPVGMAEKSFGCPTVRCPASFGHSPGRLRLSGCNRPGVIFRPVPKHPPGFAFMIKRGAPCSALEWVSPVFLVIGTMRRCKEGRRISAAIFRRRFYFFRLRAEPFVRKMTSRFLFASFSRMPVGLFPYAYF